MKKTRDDEPGPSDPTLARPPGTWTARGTRLGKYRIVGPLGQGGMGVVFEAVDTVLERHVAIKVLPKTVAGNPELLRRFQIEAKAAARLNHPNTISVHEIAEQSGYHYIVLELVRGPSAQKRMEKGPLPWADATRIIADACRGLVAAHAAGILHRDVKPANILCAVNGPAKLGDFGLAKFTDAQTPITGVNRVMGTPHYMSPEQCRSETIDDLSDVYSLGATYCALLTGKHPYDGAGAMEVMFAHCSSPVPDVRALSPSVPEFCANIVRRAMAKQPMDRFPSAAAMLAELEAALASTPSEPSSPIPVTSRTLQPRFHHWALVAGVVVLVSLVVGIAIGLSHRSTPTSSASESRSEDWKPLFNGQDLSGWKALNGRDSQWWVQDRQLVGRGDNAFLVTQRDDFQNFRLRAEVQLDSGGNSGIFFRCDDDASLPAGYEAHIGVNLGSLHRNRLSGTAPPWRPEISAEPGRWYQLEVTARGASIEIVVDGKRTVEFMEKESGPVRGRIGLQAFGAGAHVRFRRLEIQELPP